VANLRFEQTWFAEGLNSLKVAQEEFSPTTPRYLEPASATTPHMPSYLPSLPAPSPDESLQLPLSKEMALYVHLPYQRRSSSDIFVQAISVFAENL
jgi:hypothetical protein